ncbi:MAG TPA: Ig-like domain-containing protein [Kofleriaceae bacterium]|jgi:hypothetical protein|nr:Ig-like domain-containing protein [Kofleriaceae bacterium]
MHRLTGLSCLALVVACGDNPRSAPVLRDVSVTTAEDTAASVVVPLTAPDPLAVTLSVVTPPAHGTLTGAGPTWTYQPAADYHGADTAMVKAEDARGSSTATVSITVTAVNDAPVAKPDSFSAQFGVALKIAQATLLANDTDVDGDPLTVVAVAPVTGGHGAPAMSGGDVVFTSEADFAGTGMFVYTVSDGQLTAQATVTVTVGSDQPPSAAGDMATTDEDVAAAIDDATLLANDTDPEQHTLAVMAVGNAVHGSVSHDGTRVTFQPDANYNGPASFEYTITDGTLTSTATVQVTVNSVDDPPVAVDDTASAAEGAAATLIDVLANDTDIDDGPRTVASVTQPAHGSAQIAGTAIAYTAPTGYCNAVPNAAPDSFTYTLAPGGATATVSVRVSCACGLLKSTDFVVGSN